MPNKPLLVTDGQYVFAHIEGMRPAGPFNANLTEDGQVANEETNRDDPYGVPFNPRECIGGRIHTVENPMFPPQELFQTEE